MFCVSEVILMTELQTTGRCDVDNDKDILVKTTRFC